MLELLAPAGNADCAEAAINSGTDAIYLGYSSFSARQSADNFDDEKLYDIITKAHLCNVNVYVAMNTLVKDGELPAFLDAVLSVWGKGADAIILQDLFLGKYIHTIYPEIVLHLSTQAGICNVDGAKLAKNFGFSRVILARETPLQEIKRITSIIETEVFVQGALCTCYSGQCYFSSFIGGNSGNRGRCKQPCRKLYSYDRLGNEGKNYALSLSDLCVGEDIEKLIDAGVTSFKIEGRMRRKEYVAAAVRYYRIILDGKDGGNFALSDLKRAYNRGNYTKGLAFGQDKRFLSTAIQGHIGEKVGVVKVLNGQFFVESIFVPRIGDAFKILREGKEVAGAIFVKTQGKGFIISSKTRLKNGDNVFVTTDTEVNERVLSGNKNANASLRLYFHENERAVVECAYVKTQSENVLPTAQNRSLTKEEVRDCFLKTDGLPLNVHIEEIDLQGNIFIAKSQLNAFRREFYKSLIEKIAKKEHTVYNRQAVDIKKEDEKNQKTAVIVSDFTGLCADIAIWKPEDYTQPVPDSFKYGTFEKYLYYPAFLTQSDLVALDCMMKDVKFDGIYAENYAAIPFALERGIKIFAGTGFNLFNRLSVSELLTIENVSYYAISKELNAEEASNLVGGKSFVLSSGNLKLMDLCYCPFGKTCQRCDKKSTYTLQDENGRCFVARRYISAEGQCRFEIYNYADLVGKGINGAGKLLDLTLAQDKKRALEIKENEEQQKLFYGEYTSGHFRRGVL